MRHTIAPAFFALALSIGCLPGRAQAPTAPAPVTPDYPDAEWVPAAPRNFRVSDRPSAEHPINMIVIHDIEGGAEGAVRWFQNPVAVVSSHYVVDSATGKVYQTVKEKDVAYHAGNADINGRSVGIEHGGYAYRPGFYGRREYEASARLVRSISQRYQIPRDREHIIGHFEVPSPRDPTKRGGAGGHTDPGPWWDWDNLMTMIRNDARADTVSFPTEVHPGEMVSGSATLTNLGDDAWPAIGVGNETPQAIAQRARTLVYLGTWNDAARDSADFGPPSPFFGTGRTSPRLVAPVMGSDTAPNAAATFAVPFTGPYAIGTHTEQFRLFRVPTMPHTPVPFGPVLSATIQVVPWEITRDAAQSPPQIPAVAVPPVQTPRAAPAPLPVSEGFRADGWQVKPSPDGKGRIYWRQDKASKATAVTAALPPAEWHTKLPVSGQWDVYVRWVPGANRTANAQYEVPPSTSLTRNTAALVPVDQRKATPGGWYRLGRFPFRSSEAAVVRLRAAADGKVTIADAVKFVGPFAPLQPAPFIGAGPRP